MPPDCSDLCSDLCGLDRDPGEAATKMVDIGASTATRHMHATAVLLYAVVKDDIGDDGKKCVALFRKTHKDSQWRNKLDCVHHTWSKFCRNASPVDLLCKEWVAAAQAHFDWTLQYAKALAEKLKDEQDQIYSRWIEHVDGWFDNQGRDKPLLVVWPLEMPTSEEWCLRLCHDNPDDIPDEWNYRIAEEDPPNGCKFGILGFDSDIIRGCEKDVRNNWVQSHQHLADRRKQMAQSAVQTIEQAERVMREARKRNRASMEGSESAEPGSSTADEIAVGK